MVVLKQSFSDLLGKLGHKLRCSMVIHTMSRVCATAAAVERARTAFVGFPNSLATLGGYALG